MCLARWSAHSYAIGLLVLAFAAFACGSEESPPAAASPAPAAQKAAPAPAAPSPAVSPPPAAAPEPVAEAPEWTGELPVDFPADVPRYPGSKVASARGTEDLGVAVTFESPDALDVVAKFYSDGLAAEGWQAQTQQTPEGTLIIADKDDRRAHAIVHAGEQGGTLVELIIVRVE
jgi:hypothetical protein